MYLVGLDCKWYGNSPFCFGKCSDSNGRHPYPHSSGKTRPGAVAAEEFGKDCVTGTKSYCCDGIKAVLVASQDQPKNTEKGMN